MATQSVAARVILGNPTVIHRAGEVSLTIPVMNIGDVQMNTVLCTHITLGSARRTSPVGFPIVVTHIAPASTGGFAARFSDAGLSVGSRHLLTLRGSYVVNGTAYGMTLNRYVQIPPVSSPAAPALKARVEVSTTTNFWNYRLVNAEPAGSPQHLVNFSLTVAAPVTITGAPPGWLSESDNATYVLWYAADPLPPYPSHVAPGTALDGFQLMCPRVSSEATAAGLVAWNHDTDDAGLAMADYTLTPFRFS